MQNAIKLEQEHGRLLNDFMMYSVGTSAALGVCYNWVRFVLPIRSLLYYLLLKFAEGELQSHWEQTDTMLLEMGELSVATLTKRHNAILSKNKIKDRIHHKKKELLLPMVVEPCIAYISLICIGAFIQWL